MIEKLSEINTIQVELHLIVPGVIKYPEKQKLQVPGTFPMGREWYIKHECALCSMDVQVGKMRLEQEDSGWFFMHYSSRRSIPDVQLMDKIGDLFGLDLNTDFSGDEPGSYRVYSLTGIHKDMATIAYYQCSACRSQYLMAFTNVSAKNERDEVYVEKILRIRTDHSIFKAYGPITPPVSASPYKYMGFLDIYQQEYGLVKKGCTSEEVDSIEEEWGVKFPAAYREIYLIQGYHSGFGFHGGNEYTIGEYHKMLEDARGFVDPEYAFLLDDKDVFVFSANGEHSVFWFFLPDEGDDPPVYRCDYDEINKQYDSLSDCVKAQEWYRYYLMRAGRR